MNWPHIHLMLNHVPVLGTVFGALLLAYGVLRRDDAVQRAALWTFAIVALVAIPVYLTGEPAEEAVEHLAGTGERAIEAHEQAALFSLVAVELLGAVALIALLLARKASAKGVIRTALFVSFVTVGLMAWTANLGGKIRRPELRQDAAPGSTLGERESDQ
jgi:uncharacterized membrane protein